MVTLFSLEVLTAKEGDCLLLHWGDDRHVGVIDGGPAKIYEQVLRPRLLEIGHNLAIGTLPLAFVMVSHVDNDHIIGVKKLFAALRNEVSAGLPKDRRPLRVERLWHNAFTDVIGDALDAYYAKAATAALAANDPAADPAVLAAALASAGLSGVDEPLELASVLAGHGEGRQLRDDHAYLLEQEHEIDRLNAPFVKHGQPTLIMLSEPSAPTPVDGLSIQIIGPSEAELRGLKADFEVYLKKKGLAAPAALAAALSSQDNSPTNLSSVVFLVEYGGKRMLLTGDALGDRILAGVEGAGLNVDGRLDIDILKVPHHGSARNVSEAFFQKIRAQTYIFSANGRYENPDRLTLEWLAASRDRADHYHIIFTYPVADIDQRRRMVREQKGKVWDIDKDAIAPFLQGMRDAGHAFTWSEGRAVVDLGDRGVTW